MKIFLLRHGESTSDVENRYGGKYDDDLTPHGREQVHELAGYLKSKNIDHIFSSPLLRARQTAEILQAQLNCKVETLNDLRERNFYADLSGMKKEEALAKHPDLVALLSNRANTLPNGESYTELVKRIKDVWSIITTSPYDAVALITHGGPIRCILKEILDLGELKEIGDCALFELNDDLGVMKLTNIIGAKLEDGE